MLGRNAFLLHDVIAGKGNKQVDRAASFSLTLFFPLRGDHDDAKQKFHLTNVKKVNKAPMRRGFFFTYPTCTTLVSFVSLVSELIFDSSKSFSRLFSPPSLLPSHPADFFRVCAFVRKATGGKVLFKKIFCFPLLLCYEGVGMFRSNLFSVFTR